MEPQTLIEVVGLLRHTSYHVAAWLADGLKQKYPDAFQEPKIQPLLEFDWDAYLYNVKRELRGEVWEYSSSVMCFLDGRLLGNHTDFIAWAKGEWGFTFTGQQDFYETMADESYRKHLRKKGRDFVYMDIDIGGEPAGRLVYELFSDVCPKTTKNFEALCTGEHGVSQSGLPLCYKGSLFHWVVPNGWVQGGDISPGGRGDGGEAIYGQTFEDESFAVPHSKRGVLGMANKGPHSNGSQFYITLQPTPWMDRNYVAFGRVVEGVGVLKRLEEIETHNERPVKECVVRDCGLLKP